VPEAGRFPTLPQQLPHGPVPIHGTAPRRAATGRTPCLALQRERGQQTTQGRAFGGVQIGDVTVAQDLGGTGEGGRRWDRGFVGCPGAVLGRRRSTGRGG
jgi:hypothetical protein